MKEEVEALDRREGKENKKPSDTEMISREEVATTAVENVSKRNSNTI